MNTYRVTYKSGLGQPFDIEAPAADVAAFEAVVKYRKRHGTVSFFGVKDIVKSVEKIED